MKLLYLMLAASICFAVDLITLFTINSFIMHALALLILSLVITQQPLRYLLFPCTLFSLLGFSAYGIVGSTFLYLIPLCLIAYIMRFFIHSTAVNMLILSHLLLISFIFFSYCFNFYLPTQIWYYISSYLVTLSIGQLMAKTL